MKSFYLLFTIMLFIAKSRGQQFTDSNLPIVIINTDLDQNSGQPIKIQDDPKVLAEMKIIFRPNGDRNYISDQDNEDFLNYSGRIGIEFRGSSSQNLPKKPYGLTTLKEDNISNNNKSILGMPKENDWLLNSLAYDKSLIRDYVSYNLSRKIGNYAARGKYCEVVINGDYKGLYIFMEKLKVDSDRIDIVKIKESDNESPNITGGYVTKSDKTTGNDPIAWSYTTHNSDVVNFIHQKPKSEDVTSQQNDYIKSVFDNLLTTSVAQNSSISNGYPSIIDIPSFADFMLVNEIASNVDAYHNSTYFHKDRNEKLRAGPIWDFNLTYGNDLFQANLDRSFTDVWQFDNDNNVGAPFWKNLFEDPIFNCYLNKRWSEIMATGQPLNYKNIETDIDALVVLLSEAKVRENQRWGTLSKYEEEIVNLKSWITQRISWLNENIKNTQNCTFPSIPDIVISEINYNPEDSNTLKSDDLEFMALSNNSSSDIMLTGFYFRALGVGYQFPEGSILPSNSKIYLASNKDLFQEFYGFSPFGVFTRNLSNKKQELLLTDAYGNEVDTVTYSDKSPWPDADGTGLFLLLKDLSLDNNDPDSWDTSTQILGIENFQSNSSVKIVIYPNPTKGILSIQNQSVPIDKIEVYDILGRLVLKSKIGSDTTKIDLSILSSNTYILKFIGIDKSYSFNRITKN